jgi:hypothetical protein
MRLAFGVTREVYLLLDGAIVLEKRREERNDDDGSQ